MQKLIVHKHLGNILFTKRKQSKTIRVSISPSKGVRVSLPYTNTFSQAAIFVDANLNKILAIIDKQNNTVRNRTNVNSVNNDEQVRKTAKQILPARLSELSEYFNSKIILRNRIGLKIKEPFKYNRLAIKNNKTNWGSCSAKRNINLNMNLVVLPQELMDYVIKHELCHLVHMNHSEKFHKLLDVMCEGKAKELSTALRKFSLR